MTMLNTSSAVRIGKDLSEPFDTKRGFRQGDSMSCDFFNLMLEKIVRAAELNRSGTIFYKNVHMLAYIDIIGLNNRAVSSAFSKLDKEEKRMGLVVNEDKTKSLLSSNKQSVHSRIGTHDTVDSYNFEVVKDCVYLGTSINTDNHVSLEIQCESMSALKSSALERSDGEGLGFTWCVQLAPVSTRKKRLARFVKLSQNRVSGYRAN